MTKAKTVGAVHTHTHTRNSIKENKGKKITFYNGIANNRLYVK